MCQVINMVINSICVAVLRFEYIPSVRQWVAGWMDV